MAEATSKPAPWRPSLFPKQIEVFNARQRYLLLSGPRLCSKTTACLHKILRHAWETRGGARVAMFSKTIKNAKGAGVWKEMTGPIIKEWLAANLSSPYAEFGYTVEPKTDGATRMHYFRIRNYWGEEAEIQLHSLDYDGDVEAKLLETSYSLIYFSELQKFEDEAVFGISMAQLRMGEVAYEDHQWIADTNPPESGPNHFAYDLWFIQPNLKEHPRPDWQKKFGLIQFTIDDNLSKKAQQEIDDLKNNYLNDPEGWARFILGSWTHSSGHASKHFSFHFKRNIHVLGEADATTPVDDWEYLNPSEDCHELKCGWDPGHTNHSFHIVERALNDEGQSVWYILDELVSVHEKVSVEDFGYAAIEKMDAMEKRIGRNVSWDHWADLSAFRFNAQGIDQADKATLERISNGRIVLMPAQNAKKAGGVRKRVELIIRLLKEHRLFVSAHCFATIEMFEKLRKGKKELVFVLPDEHKHPFDSLTYAIYSEMLNDLEDTDYNAPSVGKRLMGIPL